MVALRSTPWLVGGLMWLAVSGRAAVLIHHYPMNGTTNDALGGPALVALGGQINSLGYVFSANEGLVFTSPIFNAASFSFEFSFRLNTPNANAKIVDFHQLSPSDDSGLYRRNGQLAFTPAAQGTPTDFLPGVSVNVVLTRDGDTNVVAGYVNGQPRFSFVDLALLAVTPMANASVIFFADDSYTNFNEAVSGRVDSIRVFNGAMSASEVSTLFTTGQLPQAIPEPSTMALLVVGAGVLLFAGRRRHRKV